MAREFSRTILFLLRLRFRGRAEFILGDLVEEYNSGMRSPAWLWRQTMSLLWPGALAPDATSAIRCSMGPRLLTSFWNDLRYAVRALRSSPGFVLVAVLAIAIGIGVNTGIFTVLNGIALRPLPVPEATQVVSVYQVFHGLKSRNISGAASLFSLPEYQTYRDDNHVLSGLLAYAPFLKVTLGGDHPRQLLGQLTSCNYFDVLKEPAALGRTFQASDCAASGFGAVVVLSDELWRGAFNADPNVVGQTIVINRQLFTVAGVAPAGFQGTEPAAASFWAPLTMQHILERENDWFAKPNVSWLVLMGRTRPGVSLPRVRADLGVIAGRIDQLTPGRKTALEIQTASFLGMPEERKIVTGVGALLLAAVGMVLLIACANVANLLLARAAGRRKEIAIRLSLGASRARLIQQLLTESLLIALLGGALGSFLALWSFQGIVQFLLSHLPADVPKLVFNVGPDPRVLGYALALTVLTGLFFGLAPALQASRPDLNTALKDEGAAAGVKSGGFLRNALVAVQVAVCMVLLISAGLLLRGLYLAQTIDPGFEMKNVAIVSFDLREQGYDAKRAWAFQQQVMERTTALPGVDEVAQSVVTPLSDNHRGTAFSLQGESSERLVEFNSVSPEYFSLLRIPIVRGRNFTAEEWSKGAGVAIVTESTAARFWPHQDPIGKTLRNDSQMIQVIGVAKDAQVSHLAESTTTYLYLPAGPEERVRMQLLVHGADGFSSTAAGLRAAIHSLDPNLVVKVTKLQDNLEFLRAPSRIVAALAGSLGALALLLASLGVYGVVSYTVSRRVREIGIRMTLGANANEVMGLILRQAMQPVALGAALGIAACTGVSRLLSAMLFGASQHDPIAFVGVPLFLFAVALLASYIPARRATKVDPMIALRYE